MMQTQPDQLQLFQPSWSYSNIINSSFDESFLHNLDMDIQMGDCDFSSSLATTEDSDDISSIPYFTTMNPDELSAMFPLEQYSPNFEDSGPVLNDQILSDEIDDVLRWMKGSETGLPSENLIEEEYEGSGRPSMEYRETSQESSSVQSLLVLPRDEMEVENQLSLSHLLKAYGEAMENKQAELVDVILKRIREKVSPTGVTVERLGYYLFQAMDKEAEYLKQESSKNYGVGFSAFYQIFPYGRFAHFTANLAILEAIPMDAETIHIVDFDMGEGVQWPPLLVAIGQQKAVRLTSIKRKEADCGTVPNQWSFEETRKRLYNYAQSFAINLEVEEMDLEDLVREQMKMKKMHRGTEWLAFNCMVGLPHMRRVSRRHVTEFLKVAKELINSSIRGIITFGDGDDLAEKMRNCCGFGSFFDEYLLHFLALFESMEWHFPPQLTEARMAMECLFLGPSLSSLACSDKWEESQEDSALQSGNMLEGWRFSKENLLQAKELVNEGESLYGVRVEGENGNVMALEWRGTPIVRVSTWR